MYHELRKRGTSERMTSRLAKLVVVVAAILLIAGVVDILLAQGSPFGVPKGGAPKAPPAPPPPPDGLFGWIIAKQNEFYRQFSGLIRQAKADGSAVWGLLGVSFLYGIFHAAGPGHGKAVISSYVVANDETWKRGVALSFASALLQALVAVLIVGIASALLNATAAAMKSAVDVIEIIAYAFIIAIGVRLLKVKGIALINAWRGREASPTTVAVAGVLEALCYVGVIQFIAPNLVAVISPGSTFGNIAYQLVGAACLVLLGLKVRDLITAWRAPTGAHVHHDHAHDEHAHAHANPGPAGHDHAHDHHAHDHAGHAHDHHHHDHDDHASAWGHAHAPEPKELAGPGGWKRGLSAIVAVGLRPCSGAIIVLVFALAQGLFWAGVAATFVMGLGTAITVAVIATIAVGARSWAARLAGSKSGYGMVAMRAIEVAAAFVIIAFGSLLLTGYLVSERIGV
jgi:nickel/cobalt transporter (NicO) family protein